MSWKLSSARPMPGDGLGNGGGLLQDGVQFLPPQHAGAHGLGELEHSRLDALGAGSRQGELLVELLGKGHQLPVGGKCLPSHGPQLAHHVCRFLVVSPGALGGPVNQVLELRSGLESVVHPLQPGGGLGMGVRQTGKRLHPAQAHIGPRQPQNFSHQTVRSARPLAHFPVDPLLGGGDPVTGIHQPLGVPPRVLHGLGGALRRAGHLLQRAPRPFCGGLHALLTVRRRPTGGGRALKEGEIPV